MIKAEQLKRIAKNFGNGAHIFVPKEWAGEEIVIIRQQRKSLKERIMQVLEPYLNSVVGAYLYGSYAREEQTKNSDVDLFIIIDKKLKIKEKGFEIICLEKKDIKKAIGLEPILIYSIFAEAKPIINSQLLEELKSKYHPQLKDFKAFFEDSERIIKINEKFLETEKGEFLSGEAVVYSTILRLRGAFIIKCLLNGTIYTNKYLKEWVKKELPEISFNSIYEAYNNSKNEVKIKGKIKVKDIYSLLELLNKELNLLKYGKKRKKA